MSFSDDFIDKSSSSIAPEFADATQISEREQLRVDIGALADPSARANAEAQYVRADVQTRHMRVLYAQRETRFVDANLKLEPEISLTIGDDTRSYADRVEQLRTDFAQSPHGVGMERSPTQPQKKGSSVDRNQPTETLRDGALRATVWENQNDKGESFTSVTLAKTYEGRDGKLQDGHSFSQSDLLRVAELAREAHGVVRDIRRERTNETHAEATARRPRRGGRAGFAETLRQVWTAEVA
ncbi:MAG: hypothetical protein AAF409_18210 [Pseudomonadota bacterium]